MAASPLPLPVQSGFQWLSLADASAIPGAGREGQNRNGFPRQVTHLFLGAVSPLEEHRLGETSQWCRLGLRRAMRPTFNPFLTF